MAKNTHPEEDGSKTIESLVRRDFYSTSPDTSVSDLLEESAKNVIPLAVVDEDNTFLGMVSRPAILSGIAG